MMVRNIRLAGVDEAGRGPLVGSVVAAAVIFHPKNPIQGVLDSKQLTEKKRDYWFSIIMQEALAVGVGEATPEEIDRINILQATFLAMQRAVQALSVNPTLVWVDGNQVPPELAKQYTTVAIVQGDKTVPEISAASIIAKVTRDRQMYALAEQYPEYHFDKHKGYPTALHLQSLQKHGVLALHRRSFAPVRKILESA
ncbi:MAG: ribonuclease [Pseudomonadota bacterium]|jgi:ribonuclease HII